MKAFPVSMPSSIVGRMEHIHNLRAGMPTVDEDGNIERGEPLITAEDARTLLELGLPGPKLVKLPRGQLLRMYGE